METHEIVFTVVMSLTAVSLIIALCILLIWKLKNFEFKSEETLPLLAKNFSKIPLIFNLVIYGLALSTVFLGLIALVFVYLIMVSISVGLASGLLGLVCSIVCIKRKIKGGIKYTVISSISTLICIQFLLAYISIIC